MSNYYDINSDDIGVGAALPHPALKMRTPFTREAQMKAVYRASMRARERAALEEQEKAEALFQQERRTREAERRQREAQERWTEASRIVVPFRSFGAISPSNEDVNQTAGWSLPVEANVRFTALQLMNARHAVWSLIFKGNDGRNSTIIRNVKTEWRPLLDYVGPPVRKTVRTGQWKLGGFWLDFVTTQPGYMQLKAYIPKDGGARRSTISGNLIGWRMTRDQISQALSSRHRQDRIGAVYLSSF